MSVLKVGDQAPPFDVKSSDGRELKLTDFRGKRNVVLYFYPRDFTRVCTAQVCGFRDMYDELVGKDTEVIGVSLDSGSSHTKFAEQYKVPFPLVADEDKSLAKAYGVIGALRGLLGLVKRVTYIIDKQGKIAGVFHAELSADTHFDGVKQTLAKLTTA
jgi:thioredoxin-dependent peroxiredoxin